MFGKGRECSSREFDSFARYGTNRDGTRSASQRKTKGKGEKKMKATIYWSPRNAYYTITDNGTERLKTMHDINKFLSDNSLTFADVISRHGQCDID